MAIKVSKVSDGQLSVIVPDCAGEVVRNFYEFDTAGVTLAEGDIIDIGVLPANATVADAVIVTDDLDTNATPTVVLDVGIMSGTVGSKDAARTCGAELFSGSVIAKTGGTERMSAKTGFRIAPVGYDRSIGVKVTTAQATAAATGKLAIQVDISM